MDLPDDMTCGALRGHIVGRPPTSDRFTLVPPEQYAPFSSALATARSAIRFMGSLVCPALRGVAGATEGSTVGA